MNNPDVLAGLDGGSGSASRSPAEPRSSTFTDLFPGLRMGDTGWKMERFMPWVGDLHAFALTEPTTPLPDDAGGLEAELGERLVGGFMIPSGTFRRSVVHHLDGGYQLIVEVGESMLLLQLATE